MARASSSTVGQYLAVTFAFSWGLLALWNGQHDAASQVTNVALPFLLGPLAGVLFVQWRTGERIFTPEGIGLFPNSWFLRAFALAPLLALLALAGAALVPGASVTLDLPTLFEKFRPQMTPEAFDAQMKVIRETSAGLFIVSNLVSALFAGATVSMVVALAEEVGWRGLLLPKLGRLGFWPASLLTGFVRGAWLVPLVLSGHIYAQHPRLGALWIVLFSSLCGPITAWLRLNGKSLFPPALFMGGLNALASFSTMLVVGGSDLTVGLTGAVGLGLLLVVNAALAVRGVGDAPAELSRLAPPA
jgi:membrane protease YdiL (CAAX protease family)